MSAIASFIKLPKAALPGLRTAALERSGSKAAVDPYYEYLRRHGRQVAEYRWAGVALATLLVYLQQKRGIDLMKSEYDALAAELTKARKATHFIFTEAHKLALLNDLDPKVLSEAELSDFFNDEKLLESATHGFPEALRSFPPPPEVWIIEAGALGNIESYRGTEFYMRGEALPRR